MVTAGLLYPGHSAADDFPALEVRIGGAVRLPVAITSVGEDAHRVDALLDLGSDDRLADGAARLADEKLEAAVGKPVLTANQVTIWKGLELVGPVPPLAGLGTLFGVRG